MTKFQPVKDYEKEKEEGSSIISISILAAIGINVFVAGLASANENASTVFILLGLLVIGISIYLYACKKKRVLTRSTTIYGFFIYNTEKKEIINIPRYGMGERLFLEMHSISEHNPELLSIWKNSEIGVFQNTKKNGVFIEHIESEGDKIIKELLEYFVLQRLSLRLDSLRELKEDEIIKLERKDIPELLKTNRILNWLTEKKEDDTKYRDFLIKHDMFGSKKITLSKEETEEFINLLPKEPYSQFEMFLPKGGTIKKRGNNIIIEHPSFSMSLEIIYGGSSSLMPRNFKNWYLGIKEHDNEHRDYQYSVKIDVKFRLWTIIGKKYKKYYRWIDNFVSDMDELMSQDTFFQKIGWETACTILMCDENRNKERKEMASESKQ